MQWYFVLHESYAYLTFKIKKNSNFLNIMRYKYTAFRTLKACPQGLKLLEIIFFQT